MFGLNTLYFQATAQNAAYKVGGATEDWSVLTNPSAMLEQRIEAEERLLQFDRPSPDMMKRIFFELEQSLFNPIIGGNSLRDDALVWNNSVARQIILSKLRVFDHFAQNMQPAEERQRVLAGFFGELFPDRHGDGFRMYILLHSFSPDIRKGEVGDNWSEDAVREFVRIFQQRGWPAGSGVLEDDVARLLLSHRCGSKMDDYREMAIERTIERKGTMAGDRLLLDVLGYDDVRISRLILDKYHDAKDVDTRRVVLQMMIERHFDIDLEPERSPAMPVMSKAWVSAFDKAGREWVRKNEKAARNGTYLSEKRREHLERQQRINSIKEWWSPGSTIEKNDGGG